MKLINILTQFQFFSKKTKKPHIGLNKIQTLSQLHFVAYLYNLLVLTFRVIVSYDMLIVIAGLRYFQPFQN